MDYKDPIELWDA
jgi:hypothetical protein